MDAIICRIKEEKEERLEEIPSYVGNYTIVCCNKEISFELEKGLQAKRCRKCGRNFVFKVEGYVACVR